MRKTQHHTHTHFKLCPTFTAEQQINEMYDAAAHCTPDAPEDTTPLHKTPLHSNQNLKKKKNL